MYIYQLKEFTPLVTDVNPHMYIYTTDWKKLRRLLHHFEITGDLCNLIGSNWCDLFTKRTIFLL